MARPADERPPRKRYQLSDPSRTGELSEYGSYDTLEDAIKHAGWIAEAGASEVEIHDTGPHGYGLRRWGVVVSEREVQV